MNVQIISCCVFLISPRTMPFGEIVVRRQWKEVITFRMPRSCRSCLGHFPLFASLLPCFAILSRREIPDIPAQFRLETPAHGIQFLLRFSDTSRKSAYLLQSRQSSEGIRKNSLLSPFTDTSSTFRGRTTGNLSSVHPCWWNALVHGWG